MESIYKGVNTEKEGNPAVCSHMDGSWGHLLSEISQIEKDKYCMISLICGN